MSPTVGIGIASAVAITLLGTALYFTGQWALSERDGRKAAEWAIDLRAAVDEVKAKMQTDFNKVKSGSDKTIARLEGDLKNANITIQKQLINASQNAAEAPMQFGDDMLRDFIRIDCLWNAGKNASDSAVRAACSREAKNADPTSAGIFFTAINPEFIKRWGEACRSLDTFGGGPEWESDNPGITVQMCSETLLVMTPETSLFVRNWINNGENYTTRLVEHALEQEKIIDIITAKNAAP